MRFSNFYLNFDKVDKRLYHQLNGNKHFLGATSNSVYELECVVLLLWQNVEVLLVYNLTLTTAVASLNPCVIPLEIHLLASDHNLSRLHCEQGTVFTEANLAKKKKKGIIIISILHNEGYFFN